MPVSDLLRNVTFLISSRHIPIFTSYSGASAASFKRGVQIWRTDAVAESVEMVGRDNGILSWVIVVSGLPFAAAMRRVTIGPFQTSIVYPRCTAR